MVVTDLNTIFLNSYLSTTPTLYLTFSIMFMSDVWIDYTQSNFYHCPTPTFTPLCLIKDSMILKETALLGYLFKSRICWIFLTTHPLYVFYSTMSPKLDYVVVSPFKRALQVSLYPYATTIYAFKHSVWLTTINGEKLSFSSCL